MHTLSLHDALPIYPRVGLEDNLYLEKGKLATNAQLVEKAIRIVSDLGISIMTPSETREKLKLTKHF